MADTMILMPTAALPEPSFSDFVLQQQQQQNVSSTASATRSQLRGSTSVCTNNDFKTWQHQRQPLFGKNLSIILIEDRKYLIGVQVAKLLKRETFNLYRSMKVKGIEIIRAVSDQVEYLMRVGAVKRGTRSVTLIAYDPTMEFVESELQRIQKMDSVSATKSGSHSDSNDSDFEVEASPSPVSGRKRSSPTSTPAEFKVEAKRSRSSDESDNNNDDDWGYQQMDSQLPEPWEILLSLARGRSSPNPDFTRAL